MSQAKECKAFLGKEDKVVDSKHIEVIRDEEDIAEFIRLLVQNNIDIYEVRKEDLSLDEAFIKKSGGEKID